MAVVYRHLRNDTGTPFYVGIGKTEKRAYSKKGRNDHWYNVAKKAGYTVDIIYEHISWDEACKVEQYLISFYGRKDLGKGELVNMTDGGEGLINNSESHKKSVATRRANGSYIVSEEKKAQISATLTGRKLSKEAIEKRTATRRANGNYNWSDEAKEKMRKPKNEEWLAKISAAKKGKPLSEETKAKMSAAHMGKKRGKYNKAQ